MIGGFALFLLGAVMTQQLTVEEQRVPLAAEAMPDVVARFQPVVARFSSSDLVTTPASTNNSNPARKALSPTRATSAINGYEN